MGYRAFIRKVIAVQFSFCDLICKKPLAHTKHATCKTWKHYRAVNMGHACGCEQCSGQHPNATDHTRLPDVCPDCNNTFGDHPLFPKDDEDKWCFIQKYSHVLHIADGFTAYRPFDWYDFMLSDEQLASSKIDNNMLVGCDYCSTKYCECDTDDVRDYVLSVDVDKQRYLIRHHNSFEQARPMEGECQVDEGDYYYCVIDSRPSYVISDDKIMEMLTVKKYLENMGIHNTRSYIRHVLDYG